MRSLLRIMFLMMAPDAGDGGGGDPPAAATPEAEQPTLPAAEANPSPGDNKPQNPATEPAPTPKIDDKPTLPKYASQLSPTKRESEDYQKYLYKHQGLDEIADDYVALNKRMERSLELPGKDAKPEDVKAFLQKLGVPENEAGYKFETDELTATDPVFKSMEDNMRKQFMRSGLTQRQANNMWGLLTDGYKQANQFIEKQRSQQAQTFDARLAATLDKTYTAKSERDAAMQETATLFKQHLQRTGMGKLYKDSGLIYNPDFVLAMASEEKARSGAAFLQGKPNGPKQPNGAFGGNYSKDFQDQYGKH